MRLFFIGRACGFAVVPAAVLGMVVGGPAMAVAEDYLDLPEKIESQAEGISLRRRELLPNAVIRPPVTTDPGVADSAAGRIGEGRLSWRFFKPDRDGVVEFSKQPIPAVVRTTPVELIRGIILLPGEIALELTNTDREILFGRESDSADTDDPEGRAARAASLRRQIETYTSGVRVAADFEGIRDHGTRPSAETVALLESLLGDSVEREAERGIAEAVILGFATAGRTLKDVIIARDENVRGVFKVVVFGVQDPDRLLGPGDGGE